MLQLKGIVKSYAIGKGQEESVPALRGVDLAFRDSEFVAVLGPSGCGKTTLLNILGGLDRYSEGDLVINGRSTREYRDADWDTYRNHSIGFVFQSYNLIPHQTVLANVELALTLSGVSRAERRRRAIEALEKVGLGDQIRKRPNQMSGGQMQRVAIARALVNDPDILLADEPTGALDTVTSVQIMEILKDISKDKLILMVTHNPELAETYANRIVRLVDGQVVGDSKPYTPEEAERDAEQKRAALAEAKKEKKRQSRRDDGTGKGKRSMSFFTALSLSFQNLMTKKTRTLLTSFAGSIGIIGIALILALSNGVNLFIATVQEDTLSTYPLTIQRETQDMSAMLGAMTAVDESQNHADSNMIHVDDSLGTMMSAMSATVSNDLTAFKAHLDANEELLASYVNDIQYTYDFDLQVFTADGKTQVNPTAIFDNMGGSFSGMSEMMAASGMGGLGIMSEMIDAPALLDQQYEVVAGEWPDAHDELVLVISSNNQISKMALYMLGVLDQGELEGIMEDLMTKGEYDTTPLEPYSYDDFLNMTFRLLNTSDFFVEKDGASYTVDGVTYPVWRDVRDDVLHYDQASFVTEHGIDLKIAGIVRPRKGVAATSISGAIGYTKALTDYILEANAESALIAQQKATPEYNALTGLKFERTVYTKDNIDKLIRTIDANTMEALYAFMTEQIHSMFAENPPVNAESFVGFAAMMDATQLRTLISQMLDIAKADPSNAVSLNMLTMALSQMLPGVQITPDNLVTLLPSMSLEQIMVTIVGIPKSEQVPMDIKGLQAMCGEAAMTGIYDYMNEQLMLMSVDDTNFATLLRTMDDEQFDTFQNTLYDLAPQTDATLESNLSLMGDAEMATPASINFFAVDFESKEYLESFIQAYNDAAEDETKQLRYTDIVGNMMSSVTIIVDAISYVLIAFVSISLVVSSIMIGIITYISVLERTKEIGILRAIGASRRDISRVFNAETLIIGFTAGAIGILFTVLACIPVTLILRSATGIASITAALPLAGGIALIIISMVLTFVAGLFPAGLAARKDPVIALRSE
ncbi:MAG: ABC transporter ATP-binding protein/permease [Clostridia bacterium]|nr:ABC transporter ATP-binding protein/permease [Clostridia bacterium]